MSVDVLQEKIRKPLRLYIAAEAFYIVAAERKKDGTSQTSGSSGRERGIPAPRAGLRHDRPGDPDADVSAFHSSQCRLCILSLDLSHVGILITEFHHGDQTLIQAHTVDPSCA